jgi:hypothetical protein
MISNIKLHKHCWHIIPGTRRKIPAKKKQRCLHRGEDWHKYYDSRGFVFYKVDKKCCICDQIKTVICEDYQVDRAMQYPTEE